MSVGQVQPVGGILLSVGLTLAASGIILMFSSSVYLILQATQEPILVAGVLTEITGLLLIGITGKYLSLSECGTE